MNENGYVAEVSSDQGDHLVAMRLPDTRVPHHLGRRAAFTSVVTLLTTTVPFNTLGSRPALAVEAKCGSLEALPGLLTKVQAAGVNGDARAAKAMLKDEPLLATRSVLSDAMGACSADSSGGATQEVLKRFTALCDELDYQSKLNYDPRWQDPEDTADLLSSIKKFKAAMEKYLASVPAP